MALHLRANTAVDVLIGPFVDITDGNTTEDGLSASLTSAATKLSKNGQALGARSDATDCAFDDDGYYNCELDVTDTNTEGSLVLIAHIAATALPVRHEYNVLSEAAWDSLYAAKDDGFMDVNIKTVGRADTQETEANNLESACSNYSATRGLTGTAVPDAVPDAAGGLPVSDAGGLDLDTLLGTLTSLAAETRSANLLDQLKTIIAVIESQRGAHTHQPGTGNIFFIDQENGATTAGGATGGISDPIDDWQDAHDTYGTDGGHDLYIMVAGNGSAVTTHVENITPTDRYCFTRGPGRDLVWTPENNSTVAITVTNTDGCEFTGFQVDSFDGTGNQPGIVVSGSDFFEATDLWINSVRDDGIRLTNCDNYVIDSNVFTATGTATSDAGLSVVAGSGQTGSYGQVRRNTFNDVNGDSIRVDTTGGGTVDACVVCDNIIQGSTQDGIDIVDSGCQDTILCNNTFGNNASDDIEDAGTNTINVNNVPWLYSTTANRSLTVTPTGAASINWADVENPTTAVDLSATDIQLCDTVSVNTDTAATLTGITVLGNWMRMLLRSGFNDATALAEINTGGSGAYNETDDSLQAIRDRGDAAWTTGGVTNLLQETTIATLATQTSFTLTAGSADDSAYQDQTAILIDQSTDAQRSVRAISTYTGGTLTVVLEEAPDFTIATGDTIRIFSAHPGSTPPTAAAVADAVWDEAAADHDSEDSFGNIINDVTVEDSDGTYQFTANALELGPTISAAAASSQGAVDENKLEATQHRALGPFTKEASVSQAGKSHAFTVFSVSDPPTRQFELTTAAGNISVGGTGDKTVTISQDDSNTGTADEFRFILTNTTDDIPLWAGTLSINVAPDVAP